MIFENLYIGSNRHLGDTILILNLIYNRSIENNISINIYGPNYVIELLSVFDYGNIFYKGHCPKNINFDFCALDFIPKHLFFGRTVLVRFLAGNHYKLITNYKKEDLHLQNTNIIFPLIKNKFHKDPYNILHFQFDSRTNHKNKMILNKKDILNLINLHKENLEPVGLGGKDTKPYVNFRFSLGNIRHIVESLSDCSKFIGIDSGISHLSGMLSVNGNIYVNHTIEQYSEELISFYRYFYKTLRTDKLVKNNLKKS